MTLRRIAAALVTAAGAHYDRLRTGHWERGMTGSRQDIAWERRRQLQVRQALAAGLAGPRVAEDARVRFLLACADYLIFAMDRLHVQDQALGVLLRERLAPDDTEPLRLLGAVNERLAMSRELVEWLRWAAGELRRDGPVALAVCEAGARRFTADFQGPAAAHRNPMAAWTTRLVTETDWMAIAGTTAASRAREAELYAAVQATAPAGADPETFAAGSQPAPAPTH